METALERRLLEPHDLGRVISAEPFDVTQDERRTVPLGQGPDGPLEHLPEVVLLGARLRSVREVRSLLERPLFDRERSAGGRRPARRLASLSPMRYSHVKNCERRSKRSMPRHARRNASWTTSSASADSPVNRRITAYDVRVIFDGAGVKWVPTLLDEEHKYHGLLNSIREHVDGACAYCARAYGAKDAIDEADFR